jgi:cytochrome c biogenesis protein CcmG, thiol:disulfide interchange protein DsbE
MRILLFFAVTVLSLAGYAPPVSAEPAIGDAAPALVVTRFDGKTFDLSALKGNVVIVNFWATWCPSCQAELSVFRSFYRHVHPHGFEMIALSADRPRLRQGVKMMMEEYFYPGAMLSDAQSNGFGDPDVLPTTYIIDTKGVVRFVVNGSVTMDSLSHMVLPLLEETPPEPSGTAKSL